MLLEQLQTLQVPPLVVVVCLVLLSTGLMYLVKRFLLKRLQKLIARTNLDIDTLLLNALPVPLTILIVLLNLLLFERLLDFYQITNADLSRYTSIAAQILIVLALVIFADRFSEGALSVYTHKSESLRNSSSILKGIAKGLVIGIGALVLLGTLGISITPIIASLGITSLAVALALQPTLENFFSGVQLVIDKPIRVGDFIELESGEQGFVQKIGWRSTWIKMLPNNVAIMPNSVLSQSKIINYYYPQKELSVPVEVGVHYNSDLEHVERVTLEVAREVLKTHKWGVPGYDTFVVYHTFDSSSINFTVMLRAQEYFTRFFIKSEFIKALHKRYAQEGIVIPYPIRAINTDQEASKM
nr:mechanosensitive ion channel family protein [Teredinibacter turnerae]